jgi:CheY-like chemotaxis protein
MASLRDCGRLDADAPQSRCILCVQPDTKLKAPLANPLAGYRASFAGSGFAALCELNRSVFDAYILDYWLPDWSGIALCREIRKRDPNGPLFFYGVTPAEEMRERAFRAGASACLCIMEDDALREKLQALLARADSRSLNAKPSAEAAVQNELDRRDVLCAARAVPESGLAGRGAENAARTKAYKAFTDAGGTRANFERWWPQVFASSVASRENHLRTNP